MAGKILLCSWMVPPATSGSATIVGSLAQQFGPDEMVVVGERPRGQPPLQWDPKWPEVIHLGTSRAQGQRLATSWRRLQLPLALGRALRVARRHDCDVVLAVFPDGMHLLVGYLVARLQGASLLAYYHNTYLENRKGLRRQLAEAIQHRVFRDAHHVFVMSAGMEELFRERYPTLSVSPLLHSFGEPVPGWAPPPEPGPTLKVVQLGSVGPACLDAAQRFHRTLGHRGDVLLTYLTGTSAEEMEDYGLTGANTRRMTVGRDEVLPALREADVCFLPHGLTGRFSPEEYATIFPTRTIEYLISGRPILAHVPAGCFLDRFLRAHDCALVVTEPDEGALQEALERLRTDAELRHRLVRNALETARQFHAPQVAAVLRERVAQARRARGGAEPAEAEERGESGATSRARRA